MRQAPAFSSVVGWSPNIQFQLLSPEVGLGVVDSCSSARSSLELINPFIEKEMGF